MTYFGGGYWSIETKPTAEELWTFDEGEVWPEKPPCPICGESIDRAYKTNSVVREVTNDPMFVSESDSIADVEMSVTERRMNIGVVKPCDHKFQNPSVLHDYVMGHKFGMGSIRGREVAAKELVDKRLW